MKYIIVLLMFWFVGCGQHVTFDKLEAEGTVNHNMNINLEQIKYYFSLKCKDELDEDYTYFELRDCIDEKTMDFLEKVDFL